jgi:hypothetical protein
MSEVDLHIHSSYSLDGEFSVLDLFKEVEARGVKLAAIADHDCIDSAREVMAYRTFSNIKWIPAIECSAIYQNKEVHLLGYGIDPHHTWFDEHNRRIKEAYAQSLPMRLKFLNEQFKLNLKVEEFGPYLQDNVISPRFLTRYLFNQAIYAEHPLLKPYIKGSRRHPDHAFFIQDMRAKAKDNFLEQALPSVHEVIKMIHEAGGLVVLSHPGNVIQENMTLLNELTHLGLDGIEAYCPYHSEIQNYFYVEYALKRKLIITCGSDYYGPKKHFVKIGQTHCPMRADEVLAQFRNKGIQI